MPKLNLFLNHHEEGTPMPDLSNTSADFLIFWEGSWFTCAWWKEGNRFENHPGTCFDEDDDFLWTEMPLEVNVDG